MNRYTIITISYNGKFLHEITLNGKLNPKNIDMDINYKEYDVK